MIGGAGVGFTDFNDRKTPTDTAGRPNSALGLQIQDESTTPVGDLGAGLEYFLADNIAFGVDNVDQTAIEAAACGAQADGFIRHFKDGYETVVGERGVTLSGGQRQRLAIARALLTDPRILILDDATSAIDSQTEDEIQLAIRRVLQGRTTLLITHRLSMIRWADKILVLHKGELIAQGSHDELLQPCELYRRIFSRYDEALPAEARADEPAAEVEPAAVLVGAD